MRIILAQQRTLLAVACALAASSTVYAQETDEHILVKDSSGQ